ncbi:hypothetical protein [Candidatus Pelagibacter sp. HIMB1611]|uniref:hypothetical protein n=1 Tax=Candidatus Pelagibacter sp. HIMB1611 TaxID=3413357 RepID=UPI003F85D42E
MKISNKDKINEHFNEIKSETIFMALKERKFKGIKRYEINHLLKTYNMNQVFSYLKIRYKKNNLLKFYAISLILLLITFSSFVAYNHLILENYILIDYLNLKFINSFNFVSFFNILLILIILNIFLCLYELVIRVFNLRFVRKIK